MSSKPGFVTAPVVGMVQGVPADEALTLMTLESDELWTRVDILRSWARRHDPLGQLIVEHAAARETSPAAAAAVDLYLRRHLRPEDELWLQACPLGDLLLLGARGPSGRVLAQAAQEHDWPLCYEPLAVQAFRASQDLGRLMRVDLLTIPSR